MLQLIGLLCHFSSSHQCQQCGLTDDGKINAWDFSYYCNMVKEKNYSVDQEKYRPYFPLPTVTKGKSDLILKCIALFSLYRIIGDLSATSWIKVF